MRRQRAATLSAVLCLGLITAALGDDTMATLGVGGLVFQHSKEIRMLKEDLYISPKQVRIHFEFVNATSKPVETIVAFPLPRLDEIKWTNSSLGTTTNDPMNFVGFKTKVNGKPVAMQVEQRAFDGSGHDVTALLNRYHVPLNPVISGVDPTKGLPVAAVRALADAHLLSDMTDQEPAWIVGTNFWWRQTFQPGKVVEIDQSYQPITGESYDVKDGGDQSEQLVMYSFLQVAACPDARTRAAFQAKLAATPVCETGDCAASTIRYYTTDYVLTTGNDWNGPIGTFHLTLDKLKPANILSTCWDAPLIRTGPTKFESTIHDFAPRKDVRIVVVE